jgi:hypothetical protein
VGLHPRRRPAPPRPLDRHPHAAPIDPADRDRARPAGPDPSRRARQRTRRRPPPRRSAPNATNTGTNDGNPLAALASTTVPFTADQLHDLYGDADTYTAAWNAAVDKLVGLGLVPPRSEAAVRARGHDLVVDRLNP